MGFSVTIASCIVLIGLIATFTAVSVAVFQGWKDIYVANKEYLDREKSMLDVELELEVDAINATSCEITVKNTGGRTIFLREQNGFQWNTIVLSYGNNSHWLSYAIEDYEVIAINVSGTGYSFDPASHKCINPGEEAMIYFQIPDGAPEIPLEAVVSIAFATHYGVTAEVRGVRQS
jgi:archaellum component FlaF (FlaF/FlaG flagellin family)